MRIENSFIPVEGVGETTERRIWREGVTTWESFDPAVDVAGVGSTTADRIESFIAEALTHLDDGDSAYFDRTFPSGSAGGSTRTSARRPAFSTSRRPASTNTAIG